MIPASLGAVSFAQAQQENPYSLEQLFLAPNATTPESISSPL
jgi:hypothetical protein